LNAALTEFLRGAPVPWTDVGITEQALLDVCEDEDLTGLLQRQVSLSEPHDWPATLVRNLDARARATAATEMLRQR